MEYTKEQLQKMMGESGSLDLSGTGITSLPDGLTVGGSLDLSGTGITSLPDGLTVGGSLDLSGTGITSLPDGLTVGGSLYLRGTGITSLPDGLTVGGSLYLSGTGITGTARRLQNGDCVPGKYLYADGILTHIKGSKTIGEYTYYIGKIKGKSVITDGVNYAHCRNIREGVSDLRFKAQKDRGAEQYKDTDMDTPIPCEECIVMYRIITGACMAGTMAFVDSLHEVKEQYTVREIIEMTKGAYGGDTFRSFFENRNN